MLKLLDTGMQPPGGFKYLCPETRTWINAASFGELIHNASQHRVGNGLGVPTNFKEQVEDQLCIRMPPGTCMQNGVISRVGPRHLTLNDILSATRTIGEFLLTGMKKVDPVEANRRAGICISCPFNQPADGCTTCGEKEVRAVVASIVGDSHTAVDANLHSCHLCGCTLKAAVWFPLELLQKYMQKDIVPPDYCWKGKTV